MMQNIKDKVKEATGGCKPLFIVLQKVWEIAHKVDYAIIRKTCKVDKKLVLFEAYNGRQYACSPRALYEEMLRDEAYRDYHFVWAFKNVKKYKWLCDNRNTTVVEMKSRPYRKVQTSAGYIITNSIQLGYFRRKEEQTMLQTWHGTPLKRLGCDIEVDCENMSTAAKIHERYLTRAKEYTHMISPSAFCTEKLITAFGLDQLGKQNIMIEKGYPRNDMLMNATSEDVNRLKKQYGIPEGKKVILYAPTFRDNQRGKNNTGFSYSLNLDFDRFLETLGDDVVILFRTHYFVATRFAFDKCDGRIINVSEVDDINELYLMSDLLITDYSSVFFDFACLKRPVVLYMYDLEEYQTAIRDFYIDLQELPFPIVETQDALEKTVKEQLTQFVYDDKYLQFNNKFNYLEDGQASKRVLDVIMK